MTFTMIEQYLGGVQMAKFEFLKIFELAEIVVKCTCNSDVTKVIKLEHAKVTLIEYYSVAVLCFVRDSLTSLM